MQGKKTSAAELGEGPHGAPGAGRRGLPSGYTTGALQAWELDSKQQKASETTEGTGTGFSPPGLAALGLTFTGTLACVRHWGARNTESTKGTVRFLSSLGGPTRQPHVYSEAE